MTAVHRIVRTIHTQTQKKHALHTDKALAETVKPNMTALSAGFFEGRRRARGASGRAGRGGPSPRSASGVVRACDVFKAVVLGLRRCALIPNPFICKRAHVPLILWLKSLPYRAAKRPTYRPQPHRHVPRERRTRRMLIVAIAVRPTHPALTRAPSAHS